MSTIKNIFLGLPRYNCFGCSPNNPVGLNLQFNWDPLLKQVHCLFNAEEVYAGFPGILHGGIQSTLLDEIAFWMMFAELKKLGFTTGMDIAYLAPVPTQTDIHVKAKVVEERNKNVMISAWLETMEGQVLTRGEITYKVVSLRFWKKHLGIDNLPDEFEQFFQ